MASLINWARLRGWWDFFSRSKQLVLIGCLEDSTNEVDFILMLQIHFLIFNTFVSDRRISEIMYFLCSIFFLCRFGSSLQDYW